MIERDCSRCGETKPIESFGVDHSKRHGRKSVCKACDNERSKAYYEANRERVVARVTAQQARRRPAPAALAPPALRECSECGSALEGRHRVVCGAAGCRDARFRRLNPEAYAAREAAKVDRRRERRRAARQAETLSPGRENDGRGRLGGPALKVEGDA